MTSGCRRRREGCDGRPRDGGRYRDSSDVVHLGSYPGGKGGAGVWQRIICEQPPHLVYVEAFLGGGAVMRHKLPAVRNVGIDLSMQVVRRARRAYLDGGWWVGLGVGALGVIRPEFICGDSCTWLEAAHLPARALVYCDPPYLAFTRRSARRIYQFEMSPEQHQALLRVLKGLGCMVQVSGYMSDLYAHELAGWRLVRFQARTRGPVPGEECVWMNYPESPVLHDYRYVGGSFRGREAQRRREAAFIARLARMSYLGRRACIAAINREFPEPAPWGDAAAFKPGVDLEDLRPL